MTTNSIVDYLKEKGQASDLSSRAKLAVDNGFVGSTQEYISRASAGTNADINTNLLAKLQTTPPVVAPPSTTPPVDATTSASSTGNVSSSSYNGNTPVVSNAPVTSSQLATMATAPSPTTFVQANTGNSFADTITKVAKMNITDANTQAIDTLKSQLQASQASEKAALETTVKGDRTAINNLTNSTQSQDALTNALETYKVKENLALYSDIQTKIVEAQKALDLGLVYEADRPARMQFITGTQSTLQKQGLATIGALQGTAAVIKGNIDLAKSFADATVNAINSDNERSFKALTTLLDLDNGKLVTLTADEKATINDRISSIEKQSEQMQKNKDDVIGYMTSYPSAFLKGGVTLLDSRETALKKMLPFLSATEQAKEQADLAYKNSQTAVNISNANKTDTTGKSDTPEVKAYKDEITQLKAKGTPYDQIINAYGALVPVAYINDLYGVKDSYTQDQRIKDQFNAQFYNADGTLKTGYKYTGGTDPKTGAPVIEKAGATGGVWDSIKNLWGGN